MSRDRMESCIQRSTNAVVHARRAASHPHPLERRGRADAHQLLLIKAFEETWQVRLARRPNDDNLAPFADYLAKRQLE
jgi:hypothetical protein